TVTIDSRESLSLAGTTGRKCCLDAHSNRFRLQQIKTTLNTAG
ncbi:hypothetical protein LSAT2_003930, partial [Lamellibrachia satsuma]